MRRSPEIAALLSVPSVSFAGEGADLGLAGSFFQMIASLALVLGIIFIFYYLSNRWLAQKGKGGARYIRVVETRFLAPKKSLLLVEVSGEYLLLSNCGDNLQLVKQIDMLEEIEVVEEREQPIQFPPLVREKLQGLKWTVPPAWLRLAPVMKKRGEVL